MLAKHLRSLGREVVEAVEPGGTEIGQQIRTILLDPRNSVLNARTELLLYFASRAQNVEEVIQPALANGAVVLCDRFTDSTLVYQGFGRGLDPEPILQLNRIACAGLEPHLTLLVDVDLEVSIARSRKRNERIRSKETRIDDEPASFHRKVRDGYHVLAERHPERIRVVDGKANMDVVAQRIWEIVSSYV